PFSSPTSRSLSGFTSLCIPIWEAPSRKSVSKSFATGSPSDGRIWLSTTRSKNTAAENGTLSGKGGQKHEFPYLTEIRDASFDAGQYEARVTIRQGRNTVTRVAPFRVIRASGGS